MTDPSSLYTVQSFSGPDDLTSSSVIASVKISSILALAGVGRQAMSLLHPCAFGPAPVPALVQGERANLGVGVN